MKEKFYEKHPVTPERKRQIISKGYQLVDIKFAPEGYEQPELEPKRRPRKAKTED